MNRFGLAKMAIGAFAAANVGMTLVNIIQAGSRRPDGRTMAQILGVDPALAGFDDIERLSRADKMQLFYAASAPDFMKMSGEFKARVLSGGVQGPSSELFTHHVFPAGRPTLGTHWEGKAFQPVSDERGWGYNIFSRGGRIFRTRRMKTYVGPTVFGRDGKDSFHLDYSFFNTDVIHSMHDEIRQINENLFICAGCMALGGGPLNPAPFALMGPASAWVGADV